jgi:hypothetical protein
MPGATVQQTGWKCVGLASCVGGKHPEAALDAYPLLGWMNNHPRHGKKVFTEDGAATVEEIALAACETPDHDLLAARFGTSAAHASQAIAYALKAQFLA